jgi:mycofactocin precursor
MSSLPVALGVTNVGCVPAVTQLTGGTVPETTQDEIQTEAPAATTEEALVEDSLVEEVSIDGMCGVY